MASTALAVLCGHGVGHAVQVFHSLRDLPEHMQQHAKPELLCILPPSCHTCAASRAQCADKIVLKLRHLAFARPCCDGAI